MSRILSADSTSVFPSRLNRLSRCSRLTRLRENVIDSIDRLDQLRGLPVQQLRLWLGLGLTIGKHEV